MKYIQRCLSLLLCILSMSPALGIAQENIPPNDGFFTSVVEVITPEESEKLERALEEISLQIDQNIVVFFIDDIFGKDINNIAKSVYEEWNLPSKSILLVISYRDRLATIVPGASTPELSPEVLAGIVQKDIIPYMREGEYNTAIVDGVEAILFHISGVYTSDRYADEESIPSSVFVSIVYALVGLVALSWLIGTVIYCTTEFPYSIAGTVLGPIIGMILLQKHALWLGIPPFVVVGILCDVGLYKLYASTTGSTTKRRKKRR